MSLLFPRQIFIEKVQIIHGEADGVQTEVFFDDAEFLFGELGILQVSVGIIQGTVMSLYQAGGVFDDGSLLRNGVVA